ncbi:WxL domain-containing protein [Enterococcus sp. 669A]|uniref:WxL domain-containing protein n=1 Tax=Candidatus Enterococcus moelleringii TaxID=2815325 RepID=A0ABS3LBW9_9ENTE|nr:WxL domain-containing protein [Enterococcus sp. 669A]MBO1307130.1 WxL domain-containing protein [Enterococcus sp. 669A]
MKRKLLAGLLASASVLGVVVLGGVTSYAADTEVGIGFGTHTDPGETGLLKLRWVPTELDFGTSNMVNKTANVEFSEVDTTAPATGKKYAVVEDSRPHGSSDPEVEWKLTAGVSDLVSTTSATTKLTGAVLKFDTDMHDYSGTLDPGMASGGIAAAGSHSATMATSYTINANSTATAITVMEDGDVSNNVTSFEGNTAMEMKNIKLSVPANIAQKGHQYKGKMTWTLSNSI